MCQGVEVKYRFAGRTATLPEVKGILNLYSTAEIENFIRQGVFSKPLLADLRQYFITRYLVAVANRNLNTNG